MLRLDTTAVETNVHWPTDSSLLWDCYRTLGNLIRKGREVDPKAVDEKRVHLRRVKKLATRIARKAQRKGRKSKDLKPLYKRLISQVEGILDWSTQVADRLEKTALRKSYEAFREYVEGLVEDLRQCQKLTAQVIWQATERVIHDRSVPNEKKLFSIFEPHTELLKRGKAGKDIEFGHMIQIAQTGEKFITDYEVFKKKPSEPTLLMPALESHEALFGCPPDCLAADKGYWDSKEFDRIKKKVATVSIAKKGSRNEEERQRELDPVFRLGQAFRAGVEGSLSFMKRFLGLGRCMNKGWKHYVATVSATVFAHNLLVLARC